jgi:cobalamin synthase
LIDWQTGLKLWLVVTVLTIFNARLCFKKIGGVTGDTLGANTEICETAVLLAAVFLK